MTAAVLLDRLQRVRKTGAGRWVACCPCHDSTSKASLAVRELPDGRVLVHDFGGCAAEDVLAAVGLEFADLFPEPPSASAEARGDRRYRSRAPVLPAGDVLRCVAADALVAATVARGIADAKAATDAEVALLYGIAGRLARAVDVTHA